MDAYEGMWRFVRFAEQAQADGLEHFEKDEDEEAEEFERMFRDNLSVAADYAAVAQAEQLKRIADALESLNRTLGNRTE